MQQALFEIEGNPRKRVIRELRSYIAVYNGFIHIEVDGGVEDIDVRDVFNIFIQEPVYFDIKSRTTVIDYYFEGEEMRYELDDETYPGLSCRVSEMLSNEWAHFEEKKNYPDTVKWFNAACAAVNISCGLDPRVFGGMFDTMEASVEQKKILADEWSVYNRAAFRELLDNMHKGKTVWGLLSSIRLAAAGFISGYLNLRGAYGYCLIAGQALQRLCRGWEDMMAEYLEEYARNQKTDAVDLEFENTKAYDMREIHQNLLLTGNWPYSMDFFHQLTEDW
jgi:hypothetical protein